MKKKILFIIPPVILAVITLIWLFYETDRWYTYRQEWPFLPLLLLHFLFPAFYFVAFIVRLVMHFNRNKRSPADVYYIVSSIVLSVACFVGLLTFLIFTSGA